MDFNKVITKNINGFEITKYECTEGQQESLEKLQTIIMQKIQRMRIHKEIDDLLPYCPPSLSPEFMAKIQKQTAEAAKPKENKIIAFDVRRSRVTEFMSQILLEHEFGCVFSDEYDKRMNLQHHETDKHVGGVDVTGYRKDGDDFRFIICEVKASAQKKVPSTTAADLYDDVKLNVTDHKRVVREIADVAMNLGSHNEDFEAVMTFLLTLIADADSRTFLKEKITIVPFFIRQFPDNVQNNEWDKEFAMYDKKDTQGHDVVGYLWSFEHNLEDFVKTTYEKATA